MRYCGRTISTSSKYKDAARQRCFKEPGHAGKCEQYPHLSHLSVVEKRLAEKIKRDATMTTGAAWASNDAGPNRILRWVMLLSDEQLLAYGIDMAAMSAGVQAKLREKSASYEDCMAVSRRLTWSAYGVAGAPAPSHIVKEKLEAEFGPIEPGSTVCLICRFPLEFSEFAAARRGKAVIETAHSAPRRHDSNNVGFAHRTCNIAQGDKPLEEFYGWIGKILENVSKAKGHA